MHKMVIDGLWQTMILIGHSTSRPKTKKRHGFWTMTTHAWWVWDCHFFAKRKLLIRFKSTRPIHMRQLKDRWPWKQKWNARRHQGYIAKHTRRMCTYSNVCQIGCIKCSINCANWMTTKLKCGQADRKYNAFEIVPVFNTRPVLTRYGFQMEVTCVEIGRWHETLMLLIWVQSFWGKTFILTGHNVPFGHGRISDLNW